MKWFVCFGFLGAFFIAQAAVTSQANKKTAAAAKTSVRTRKGKTTRARKPPASSYQLHPDPERYAEIQRALTERGYFQGEANGDWKEDSVTALRRFQSEQKLPDDGKISSLTLKELGLGPHHDGSTAATVPLPNAAPSEPTVSGSTVGPASSPVKKEPPQ